MNAVIPLADAPSFRRRAVATRVVLAALAAGAVAATVGVLLVSVLLFLFRRVVQDKQPITLREEAATMPTPEQMALLEQEVAHT